MEVTLRGIYRKGIIELLEDIEMKTKRHLLLEN